MISKSSGMITGAMPMPGPPKRADPMLEPLFWDLSDVLEKVTQPLAHELKKYVQLNGRFLLSMRPDIIIRYIAPAPRIYASVRTRCAAVR